MAKKPLRVLVNLVFELELNPEYVSPGIQSVGETIKTLMQDKTLVPFQHLSWWFADQKDARKYLLPNEGEHGCAEDIFEDSAT